MFDCNELSIIMVEGDYGIDLPIAIEGVEIQSDDEIKLKITKCCEEILSIVFTNIQNNTFNLIFSEEQSSKLVPGQYYYSVDWYKNGVFMCNIVQNASFRVVDKA